MGPLGFLVADECWGSAGPTPVPCAKVFWSISQPGCADPSGNSTIGDSGTRQVPPSTAMHFCSQILRRISEMKKPGNELPTDGSCIYIDSVHVVSNACCRLCRHVLPELSPSSGSTGLILWPGGQMPPEGKWLNRRVSVVETAVVPRVSAPLDPRYRRDMPCSRHSTIQHGPDPRRQHQ